MKKTIFIIFGSTGVGKTACADYIAELKSVEIINMDMGQLYTPLSIGTAKPDWKSSPIKHHMFDVINEPISFSVAEYRSKIKSLIGEICQRGNIPILVGGSGFYLHSLFFPPQSNDIPIDTQLPYSPYADLWHELYMIDPERALCIDKHDAYRIKRALSIWHATGEKPSSFAPQYKPIAPFKLIYLTRDRSELYMRINERVRDMLAQGWIDEVKHMLDTPWESFILNKKIIGYDDIIMYLRGEQTQEALSRIILTIQQRTRHYAKRQMTYWRMLKKNMMPVVMADDSKNSLPFVEVDLTTGDLDLYIKKLLT